MRLCNLKNKASVRILAPTAAACACTYAGAGAGAGTATCACVVRICRAAIAIACGNGHVIGVAAATAVNRGGSGGGSALGICTLCAVGTAVWRRRQPSQELPDKWNVRTSHVRAEEYWYLPEEEEAKYAVQ